MRLRRHVVAVVIAASTAVAAGLAGCGVPIDRAETIFKPFFTSKSRGTGLGLSISRRIMEMHGGRLVLDNPGMQAASFTFMLPSAPPASS